MPGFHVQVGFYPTVEGGVHLTILLISTRTQTFMDFEVWASYAPFAWCITSPIAWADGWQQRGRAIEFFDTLQDSLEAQLRSIGTYALGYVMRNYQAGLLGLHMKTSFDGSLAGTYAHYSLAGQDDPTDWHRCSTITYLGWIVHDTEAMAEYTFLCEDPVIIERLEDKEEAIEEQEAAVEEEPPILGEQMAAEDGHGGPIAEEEDAAPGSPPIFAVEEDMSGL